MKRILVTGGAGFVGSNLSERLLACGDEILSRQQNILHLFDTRMFEFLRHDTTWSLFREEAFNLSTKRKIHRGSGRETIDALTGDRLYSMLGQEVEREMMPKNRKQFGFRAIASPRRPDRHKTP